MFCQFCGTAMPDNAQFCTNCGRQQPVEGAAVTREYVTPTNVHADTGRWLGEGWNVVQSEWLMFALITLVFVVISGAIPVVLQGAMIVGIHIVSWRKLTGGKVDINDLFKGFNYFVPSLAAFVVIAVFAALGFLLCIIPGLVILAMYKFTYLFIADKKMDFWAAMQASHAIVRQDYFGFTWFVIAAALLNLLGALLCGVGLLLTVPLTYVAITAAYRDIVGFEPGGVM
jgi:uncharacterized membrane protein